MVQRSEGDWEGRPRETGQKRCFQVEPGDSVGTPYYFFSLKNAGAQQSEKKMRAEAGSLAGVVSQLAHSHHRHTVEHVQHSKPLGKDRKSAQL